MSNPQFRQRIRSRVVIDDNGCWMWQLYKDRHGYGRWQVAGVNLGAHRVSFEAFVGPIPDGLELDHTCHTEDQDCPGGIDCRHRACVNPAHLEPVTSVENVARSVGSNGTKTKCPAGHAYDESNTYVTPAGTRQCRTCRASRSRERYRRTHGLVVSSHRAQAVSA